MTELMQILEDLNVALAEIREAGEALIKEAKEDHEIAENMRDLWKHQRSGAE